MTEVSTTLRTAYLAGPMTGIEAYNFPEFHKQTAWLRGKGWEVYSPAEEDEHDGFDPLVDVARDFDYYMSRDLAALCTQDAVILLGGWEKSKGARLEAMVAVEVGNPVFEIVYVPFREGTIVTERKLESVPPSRIAAEFIAGVTSFNDLPTLPKWNSLGEAQDAAILEGGVQTYEDPVSAFIQDMGACVDCPYPSGCSEWMGGCEKERAHILAEGITDAEEFDPPVLKVPREHIVSEMFNRYVVTGDLQALRSWETRLPEAAGGPREHIVSETEECWCYPEIVSVSAQETTDAPFDWGRVWIAMESNAQRILADNGAIMKEAQDALIAAAGPISLGGDQLVDNMMRLLNAEGQEKIMTPPLENRNDDVVDVPYPEGFEERYEEGYTAEEKTAAMRAFATGATRNVEVDPDIYGFTSPLAIHLFGRYMHRHQEQADGTLRKSDNWKAGIPLDSYIRSLRRHLQDLTLHHDGYGELAREGIEEALGGLIFNCNGYAHEYMKESLEGLS